MEENSRDDSSIKAFSNRVDLMPSIMKKTRVSSFESVTKYLENKCANYSPDDIDDIDNWSMKSFNSSYSENDISNMGNRRAYFSIGDTTLNDNQNNLVKQNKYNILQWLSTSSGTTVNADKQQGDSIPRLLKSDKKGTLSRDINTFAPTIY